MTTSFRPAVVRTVAVAAAVSAAALVAVPGQAAADVKSGAYTSTTWAGNTVLLKRVGHVEHGQLVLIGHYPIHNVGNGGYVDFFPGHRVFMNSDGHGGYRGPAFLGGVQVGTFTLTPRG